LNLSHEQILQGIALAVATVAAIIDWRTTKIPNLLTFPATVVGLILNAIFGMGSPSWMSWPGVFNALLGAVVGALLTVVFSGGAKKKIGFGDAKLLMAMGAFLGWVNALLIFFWFAIVWGFVAVWRIGGVIPWKTLIGSFIAKKSGGGWFTPETAKKIHNVSHEPIPVGPWLALGVLLAELVGKATLQFMGFE
jgi:prepilin signal peptidase PulO-like enzyme (type II secretory pathway)